MLGGLAHAGLILLVPVLPVAAQSSSTWWYIQGGAGISSAGDLTYVGSNVDTGCYPYQSVCVEHDGYRWVYDYLADPGPGFAAALGFGAGRLRMELGFRFSQRNLDSRFSEITFLDGRALPPAPPASDYASKAFASVEALSSRAVYLAAYYRLLSLTNRVHLYAGAGTGLTMLRVSDVHYADIYTCLAAVCIPDPVSYSSIQLTDFSDEVLAGHLMAGVEVTLSPATALLLEASFSAAEDLKDQAVYVYHSTPGLTSKATVANVRQTSVMVTVQRRL